MTSYDNRYEDVSEEDNDEAALHRNVRNEFIDDLAVVGSDSYDALQQILNLVQNENDLIHLLRRLRESILLITKDPYCAVALFTSKEHSLHFLDVGIPKVVRHLLHRKFSDPRTISKVNAFFRDILGLINALLPFDFLPLIETLYRLLDMDRPFYKSYGYPHQVQLQYSTDVSSPNQKMIFATESNHISRFLTDNINYFGNIDGFTNLLKNFSRTGASNAPCSKNNNNQQEDDPSVRHSSNQDENSSQDEDVDEQWYRYLKQATLKKTNIYTARLLVCPIAFAIDVLDPAFLLMVVPEIKDHVSTLVNDLNQLEGGIKSIKTDHLVALLHDLCALLNEVCSSTEANEVIQQMHLIAYLQYLKCPILEKRLFGLAELYQLAIANARANMESQSSQQTNRMNVSEWLVKRGVVEELLGANSHVELLKRSAELFQVIAHQGFFSLRHLHLLWCAAIDKHEADELAIYLCLEELATLLEDKAIHQLLTCILVSNRSSIGGKKLQLISSLTADVPSNSSMHDFALQVLWILCQDEVTDADLKIMNFHLKLVNEEFDKENAGCRLEPLDYYGTLSSTGLGHAMNQLDHLLSSRVSIIRNHDLRKEYLNKCINNIKQFKSVLQSQVFFMKLVLTFTVHAAKNSLPGPNRAELLMEMQLEFDLLEISLQEVVNYTTLAQKAAKHLSSPPIPCDDVESGSETKISDLEMSDASLLQIPSCEVSKGFNSEYNSLSLVGKHPHLYQVNTRLRFLRFILVQSNSAIRYNKQNVITLWRSIIERAISTEHIALCLKWFDFIISGSLDNTINNSGLALSLIDTPAVYFLFQHGVCKWICKCPEQLMECVFECFSKLFTSIREDFILYADVGFLDTDVTSDDVTYVAVRALWTVSLQCLRPTVVEDALNMLTSIYLNGQIDNKNAMTLASPWRVSTPLSKRLNKSPSRKLSHSVSSEATSTQAFITTCMSHLKDSMAVLQNNVDSALVHRAELKVKRCLQLLSSIMNSNNEDRSVPEEALEEKTSRAESVCSIDDATSVSLSLHINTDNASDYMLMSPQHIDSPSVKSQPLSSPTRSTSRRPYSAGTRRHRSHSSKPDLESKSRASRRSSMESYAHHMKRSVSSPTRSASNSRRPISAPSTPMSSPVKRLSMMSPSRHVTPSFHHSDGSNSLDGNSSSSSLNSIGRISLRSKPVVEIEEDQKDVSQLLANDENHFDTLFSLLALPKLNFSLKQLVWNLITSLPVNKQLQTTVRDCSNLDWTSLLGCSLVDGTMQIDSNYKLLYGLRIIEDLIRTVGRWANRNYREKLKFHSKWREMFVSNGGLRFMYDVVMTFDFQLLNGDHIDLLSLTKLIHLLQLMFSTSKQLQDENDQVTNNMETFFTEIDMPALCHRLLLFIQSSASDRAELEGCESGQLVATMDTLCVNSLHMLLICCELYPELASDVVFGESGNQNALQHQVQQLILHPLISVREQFILTVYQMCRIKHPDNQVLGQRFLAVLLDLLPSVCRETEWEHCRKSIEYFQLLKRLLLNKINSRHYQEQEFVLLLKSLSEHLLHRGIIEGTSVKEQRSSSVPDLPPVNNLFKDDVLTYPADRDEDVESDPVLLGLLVIVEVLVSDIKEVSAIAGKLDGSISPGSTPSLDVVDDRDSDEDDINFHACGILNLLFNHCLYSIPVEGKNSLPLCKASTSRSLAARILLLLCRTNKTSSTLLAQLMYKHYKAIMKSNSTDGWLERFYYDPSEMRTAISGYVGLENKACVCYMNAVLFQLYMVKSFREGILSMKSSIRENERADSVLYQLQVLFGYLQESKRIAYDPSPFHYAFKDLDGKPTDPRVQQDAEEFLARLCDRLDVCLQGSECADFVKDAINGTCVHQIIYEVNGKQRISEREDPFTVLTVEIKNKRTLEESLNLMVDSEILDGDNAYYVEEIDQKVACRKRLAVGRLPDTLFIHLKRFEFDFDSMMKYKLNSKLEFPMILDMEPYTKEGLLRREREKEESDNHRRSSSDNINVEISGSGELNQSFNKLKTKEHQCCNFQLSGVVVHIGDTDAGHYYSFIRGDEPDNSGEVPWFEFNDNKVTKFDPDNIPDECFGGEEVVNHWEANKMVQRVHDRSRNAYMLVYTKVAKEEPQQQQQLPEKNKSFEETCNMPTHIYKAVWKDNLRFMLDLQIFSPDYFCLVEQVVKHAALAAPEVKHTHSLPQISDGMLSSPTLNQASPKAAQLVLDGSRSPNASINGERHAVANEQDALTVAIIASHFFFNVLLHSKKVLSYYAANAFQQSNDLDSVGSDELLTYNIDELKLQAHLYSSTQTLTDGVINQSFTLYLDCWIRLLDLLHRRYAPGATWVLTYLTSPDNVWLFHYLFDCFDEQLRLACYSVVENCFYTVMRYEKETLNDILAPAAAAATAASPPRPPSLEASESIYARYQAMSYSVSDAQCKMLKQSLVSIKFMDAIFNMLADAKHYWRNFHQYLQCFELFAQYSHQLRGYMIQQNIIARLIKVYLGYNETRKLQRASKMGNEFIHPNFDPLMNVLSTLACCCCPPLNANDEVLVPGKYKAVGLLPATVVLDTAEASRQYLYQMPRESAELLSSGVFITKLVTSSPDLKSLQLLQHIVHNNLSLSKEVNELVLQALDKASHDQLLPLFETTTALLRVRDMLQQQRIEELLSVRMGLLELAYYYRLKFPMFTANSVRFVVKLMEDGAGSDHPDHLASRFLTKLRQQGKLNWIDAFLTDEPEDEVLRSPQTSDDDDIYD